MKLKVKKQQKQDTTLQNILDKRIKLPNNIRLGAIGIIFLFLIFSVFSVTAIDEEPTVTFKTNTVSSHSQNGNFDYTIYLKDNTVYNGRKTIQSQDNLVAFRNIVDHITGSFTYSFHSTETATIKGEYRLTARIETSIWNKEYTLASGKFTNNFNEEFPIDYLFYENVTSTIDAETGVAAASPQLIIQCSIYNLEAGTYPDTFNPAQFSPSVTIPLNEKTIAFSDDLKNQVTDVETSREEITTQNVNKNKDQWTANSYIFVIAIIVFSLITKGDVRKLSEIEKQVKKTNKKYNEWIVEIDTPPKRPLGTEIITIKTLEDLMKISEELGKPVMHHVSESDGTYAYYVLDESVHYKYIIYDKEKFIEHLVADKDKYKKIDF